MNKTVLVIAAHPDDEALGCAGTILKHTNSGDPVHLLFLADGEGARGSLDGLEARKLATIYAARLMGITEENITFLNFPDNRMDSLQLLDVVQKVEPVISRISPQIIYTHHHGDLNIDHRITHQSVLTVCRPMPGNTIEAIYGFEVLSSTGWASSEMSHAFTPNRYVDISEYLEKKLETIACYQNEMRPYPHARSIKTVEYLAKLRGSSVGVEAAEAFSVIREIIT